MTTLAGTPRRRWPLRYRLGALAGLALLLQGCFLIAAPFSADEPSYFVPGVGEVFGRPDITQYPAPYVLKEIDPQTGRYKRIYAGDPRYGVVARFFAHLMRPANSPPDRSGIPGGSGTLPPPAVP